jgi:hypothetical protein
MFLRLLYSVLPSINPQPFVKQWRFYGEPVDPRQQQDAVEFFQLLMDQLGDTLYKGSLSHRITGDDFDQTRLEEFWAIPMEVKGCKVFEESVRSLLQKETHTGFNAEPLGKQIDVQIFTRVAEVPNFLVVHLKRFEYDVGARESTKVNDKFEFPDELDLRQLMEHKGQPELYHLTGVILHTGTALGGHYTSYIRINEKWYSFDDVDVHEISEATVKTDCYGGQQYSNSGFSQHYPSAYLLFYSKETSPAEDVVDRERDSALLAEIESENRSFLRMQAVFAPSLVHLLLKNEDPEIQLEYFFNVFVHSNNTITAELLTAHFLDVVNKNEGMAAKILGKINDIIAVLSYGSSGEITKSFLYVIETLLKTSEAASPLVESLLDHLPNIAHNWRVIPHFMQLIFAFLRANPTFVSAPGWISRVLSFMQNSLQNTKSSVFLQNIDFSSAFLFFTCNCDMLTTKQLETLRLLGSIVIQSSVHSASYTAFIHVCCERGFIQISEFLDDLISSVRTSSDSSLVSVFMQFATTEEAAMRFLMSQQIPKELLIQGFESHLTCDLRNRLLEIPSTLFFLITSNSRSACAEMENFMLALFPEVTPLLSYCRASSGLEPDPEWTDFSWMDSVEVTLPSPEEHLLLVKILYAFVDGARQIIDRPHSFLSGDEANVHLNEYLRVMFWLMIRTGADLCEARINTILGLFDAFKAVSLVNDSNMVELIRVVRALPVRAARVLQDRFCHIAEIVFTMEYGGYHYLEAWGFTAFFETFESFLESHAQSFNDLIEMEFFRVKFAVISTNTTKSVLTRFMNLASTLHADVSKLIRPHFSKLLSFHQTMIIHFVAAFPDFAIDEPTFDQVIGLLLDRLSVSIADASPMWPVIGFVRRFPYSLRSVERFSDDLAKLFRDLSRLANLEVYPVTVTFCLLTTLASRSESFRVLQIKTINRYGARGPLLPLKCKLLRLHSKAIDEFRAALRDLVAVVTSPYQRPTTDVAMQLLTELVEDEGPAEYMDLMAEVFQRFVAMPGITGELWMRVIVQRIDPPVLAVWMRAAFAVARVIPNPDAPWLLRRVDDWIQTRPGIRQAVVDGLGLTAEQIIELNRTCGQAYLSLFSDDAPK